MASKYFDETEVTPEAESFVNHSFAIADQIRLVLRQHGLTQRDLAARLGKKESEVSRMLSGMHNFTLRTIARLEAALDAKLITTPCQAQAAVEVTLQEAISQTEVVVAAMVDWSVLKVDTLVSTVEEPPGHRASSRTEAARRRTQKAASSPAAFSLFEGFAAFA